MHKAINIEEAIQSDYEAILVLNELAVPHVNSISMDALNHLHAQSISLGVAHLDGQVAGYLLALDQSGVYTSLNFQWFVREYTVFTYVDRIVVGSEFRRRGIAEALYAHLCDKIPQSCPVLTCEVNTKPANPGSMAFHATLGFEPVGEQSTEQGTKSVCMLANKRYRRNQHSTCLPHARQ